MNQEKFEKLPNGTIFIFRSCNDYWWIDAKINKKELLCIDNSHYYEDDEEKIYSTIGKKITYNPDAHKLAPKEIANFWRVKL